MELFDNLKNYEGYYMINRLGQIKTLKRKGTDERILKDCVCKNGYKAVSLCKNGVQKTKTIHRLLAIQYLDNNENKRCIDHIDRNRLNNNLENLRWATYSENNFNVKKLKGFIVIDKNKIKNKEYIYYKVCIGNNKKRFKTKEDAENYLNNF